mmetsp:Transcript_39153/g.85400  ORF Transcript_39153/g.85400 Transcript_39153/m.85400 type:complete len:92 (+) Transcript_39153:45-320(+)
MATPVADILDKVCQRMPQASGAACMDSSGFLLGSRGKMDGGASAHLVSLAAKCSELGEGEPAIVLETSLRTLHVQARDGLTLVVGSPAPTR